MQNPRNPEWETSLGLLQHLQQGDDEGWHKFVHLYTPLIYFWCRKAGLQEADAADVCQEVFRAVAKGIDSITFGGPSDSFRGWLWTITRRTLGRHFGKEHMVGVGGTDAFKRLTQLPDWINDESVPEAESAEAEVIRRAADLIRGDFAQQTWQAFWLSTVDEVPSTEVAERLGMTANSVRQAKFRVMSRLKEYVGFA